MVEGGINRTELIVQGFFCFFFSIVLSFVLELGKVVVRLTQGNYLFLNDQSLAITVVQFPTASPFHSTGTNLVVPLTCHHDAWPLMNLVNVLLTSYPLGQIASFSNLLLSSPGVLCPVVNCVQSIYWLNRSVCVHFDSGFITCINYSRDD